MKLKKSARFVLPFLLFAVALSPVQLSLAQTAAEVEILEANSKKIVKTDSEDAVVSEDVPVLDENSKTAKEDETLCGVEKTKLSRTAKVGIGVGAAVLVGGVVALAAGGGGSDGGGSSSSSSQPPTAEHLVDAWQATADQPGSGLTYTGTYQLYNGGAISYAVYISDGQQFSGGGRWTLEGYRLTIRTDHGSVYSGTLEPGNINTVDLNANTGWNLHLAR